VRNQDLAEVRVSPSPPLRAPLPTAALVRKHRQGCSSSPSLANEVMLRLPAGRVADLSPPWSQLSTAPPLRSGVGRPHWEVCLWDFELQIRRSYGIIIVVIIVVAVAAPAGGCTWSKHRLHPPDASTEARTSVPVDVSGPSSSTLFAWTAASAFNLMLGLSAVPACSS
jgi:hypothetical protein